MRLSLLIPAHRHEIFTVATLRERLAELGCEVDLEIGEAGDPDSATGDACLLANGCQPDDWPSLVEAFEAGAQVVYGSRLLGPGKPAGMLWSCYLGHRLRTTLANQLFDLGLSDEAPEVVLIATGLLQSLPALASKTSGRELLAAELGARDIPVAEVPVQFHPHPRSSHQPGLRSSLAAAWTLVRHRLQ